MYLRVAAAVFALALSLLGRAVAAEPSVAQQWLYVAETPNGPAAIFLDWTYSGVILRIHCDKAAGELVFIAPDVTQNGPPYDMDLSVDDERPIKMRVNLFIPDGAENVVSTAPRAVVGRLKLTPRLLASIARAVDIDIGAPNDMDEAWHVGRAEPFRRVARSCPAR